jgi:hypothetical protein
MRDANKKATRMIHSSQSYNKKFNKRSEFKRENLYKDIFLLNEENNEESSEDDAQSEINIILLYNKDKISIKFNQNHTFEDYVKILEKQYFRVGFKENYKIYYENNEISMTDKRKINKIVKITDKEVILTLKAIKKEFLNSKMKRIYIQLDNIPSFMDLSEQINKFIKSQKDEEINYDINYKDNSCSILFSSQEISFSFVAYMTDIKFNNKYYRKLKIDIKYNPVNATSNRRNKLRLMSEDNTVNNINNTIESLPIKNGLNPSSSRVNNRYNMRTYKSYKKMDKPIYYYENTYENDYYEDNFKSIQDSTPYGYEKELERKKKLKDKKNWVAKRDFFTSVNKKSFNKLIRPKKRLILKKINNEELNPGSSGRSRDEKFNEMKSYNNPVIKFRFSPD